MVRDRAVDNWLMQVVGPAYDALKANPARAVTLEQLRKDIDAIVFEVDGGEAQA